MHKKGLFLLFIIAFSIFSLIPPVHLQVKELCSLQNNKIPFITLKYEDYSFLFEYGQFYLRVAPFVIYGGEYHSLAQIMNWLSNHYPSVNFRSVLQRFKESVHYGFNLTHLPLEIADNLDAIGFKLMDRNFPLSWFELEDRNIGNTSITLIKIPRLNMLLHFQDLFLRGYSVSIINATYVLIGDVRGKSNLNIDPVIKSGDIIQITGYTEGNRGNYEDIYEADLNGELLLLDNATQGDDQSLDVPMRPLDSGALKLKLVVLSYSPPSRSVDLNGTDFFGNTITESILISGIGNYTTTYSFASIYAGGIDIIPNIILDIYQPRWGVIAVQEEQVYLTTIIQFGDGSTVSYFGEYDKQVFFNPYWDIGFYDVFRITNNADVEFGVYDGGISSKGVDYLDGGEYLVFTSWFCYAQNGGNLSWSGSRWSFLNADRVLDSQVNAYVELHDLFIDPHFTFTYLFGYIDLLDHISIVNSYIALDNVRGASSINDLRIMNCSIAFELPSSVNVVIRNVEGINLTNGFYNYPALSFAWTLINTNLDSWTFVRNTTSTQDGKVYRKYTVDFTFSYETNGSRFEGVNLTISNAYSGWSASFVTNSSGQIPTQTLTHGYYDRFGGNVMYDYGLYEINATYGEFWMYHAFITPDRPLDLFIAVHDPKPSTYAIYLVGFLFIAIIIGGVIAYSMKWRKPQ